MANPKHTNQVRIIAGTHRGRKLPFATAEGLRPTPDSVRERLFNWLGQDLTGQTVLDLFSGSGALGFEAASRNAKRVVLIENNRTTAQILKKNSQTLQLPQIEIHHTDALHYLRHHPNTFNLIFLDPPYAWQQWQDLFPLLKQHLAEQAFIYLEAAQLPELPEWLTTYREGKAGMSQFKVLQYQPINETS